jgi:hypothetical protein
MPSWVVILATASKGWSHGTQKLRNLQHGQLLLSNIWWRHGRLRRLGTCCNDLLSVQIHETVTVNCSFKSPIIQLPTETLSIVSEHVTILTMYLLVMTCVTFLYSYLFCQFRLDFTNITWLFLLNEKNMIYHWIVKQEHAVHTVKYCMASNIY